MTLYDDKTVAAASDVVEKAIGAALEAKNGEAVVCVAPAGAGKSYAIGSAVEAARARNLRVAVASPTNEQAYALVHDIAERLPRQTITFVPASDKSLPPDKVRRNVQEKKANQTAAEPIVIGTLSKLGDANARGDLASFDLLLVDEAYQANSVHYYGVGDLARRHLLMGDSGQLAPFSTAPDADRWRGLAENPLLTAVEVISQNHPSTKRYKLPITRRLDPRALPVARAFYRNHEFRSAVLENVRQLDLGGGAARGKHSRVDRILDHARAAGWAHVELPATAVLSADPASIEQITRLVIRLFERTPRVRCERDQSLRSLGQEHVAVVVSHNDQKNLLRHSLDGAGLNDVVVNTANKLQGLTFEVVVAWHPLAGLLEADEFHVDPGRLCVMLTRHRQACIVVGRAGDRELVRGIPPETPSYLGWESNPTLDGWYVHEAVFAALAPHRMVAA